MQTRKPFRLCNGRPKVILPIMAPAFRATCKRIRKACEMPARLPYLGVHGDGGIEPDHIISEMNIVAPPETLHIVLELNAQWAVVPRGAQSPVNFARLKNESSPLGQRHDL